MNPTEIEAALEGILKATGGAGHAGAGPRARLPASPMS